MAETNIVNSYSKKESLLIKLYLLIALVVECVLLVLFLSGTATFCGKSTSVFNSVDMLLGIFNMGRYFYRGIFGTVIGIIYIFVLIVSVRKLIMSAGIFRSVFFRDLTTHLGSGKDNDIVKHKVILIDENIGVSFIGILFHKIACDWVWKPETSPKLVFAVAITVISVLAIRMLYMHLNSYKHVSIAIGCAYVAVFCAALILCVNNLKGAYVYDVITKFDIIGDLYEGSGAVIPILFDIAADVTAVITVILLTVVMFLSNGCFLYQTPDSALKSKSVLIAFAITVIFRVSYSLALGRSFDMDYLTEIISQNLPTIFAAVALMLATRLPLVFERANVKKLVADSYAVLESGGVLRILDEVTEIPSGAFQDRRDITSVYIHAGVTKVGKDIFYGCGALSAINCEAKGCPEGWSGDWHAGCYATVNWGVSCGSVSDSEKKADAAN